MMQALRGRKLLSVLVVLAMLFTCSAVAFAADSDPNMTAPNSNQFSQRVDGTQTATLQAGPANSGFVFTGFDSATSAQGVTWTVVSGNASLVSIGTPTQPIVSGKYVSQVIVSRASGISQSAHGPVVIRATRTSNSAYVEFTVVVDATSAQTVASNVKVAVFNGNQRIATGTVTAALPASGNPLYNTAAAQTYSTPAAAVVAMIGNGINSAVFQNNGTYLYSIDNLAAQSSAPYKGWTYRVYEGSTSTKTLDATSADTSIAGYDLGSYDGIILMYDTWADANTWFANNTSYNFNF